MPDSNSEQQIVGKLQYFATYCFLALTHGTRQARNVDVNDW